MLIGRACAQIIQCTQYSSKESASRNLQICSDMPFTRRYTSTYPAPSGHRFTPDHRAPTPSPPPLRVAKTGKNPLNEEITPLLPTGKRFSQTISTLCVQRSCADMNSPYKRKCWTNSGGPLVNSLLCIADEWQLTYRSARLHRLANVVRMSAHRVK